MFNDGRAAAACVVPSLKLHNQCCLAREALSTIAKVSVLDHAAGALFELIAAHFGISGDGAADELAKHAHSPRTHPSDYSSAPIQRSTASHAVLCHHSPPETLHELRQGSHHAYSQEPDFRERSVSSSSACASATTARRNGYTDSRDGETQTVVIAHSPPHSITLSLSVKSIRMRADPSPVLRAI
ncbi:hypothetical protein HPB51_023356 [Rhipicephalus microplus]|uniref:Uncharacterized protein n=1 Tax=Rhipicephalus microplus TaxID=6941 RepID=A0A9J6EJZ3_RHIMP|nr:hypothetical protein HPB51_023356 [Rhipicephalus microplus]